MTEDQNIKCHAIIHSAAVIAAGGNIAPVPGLGIAVDTLAMGTMVMALASLFDRDIKEKLSKNMAVMALKNTMFKQPIKAATKELSKFIPILGQLVAPTVTLGLIEAAGWQLARELENGSYTLNYR